MPEVRVVYPRDIVFGVEFTSNEIGKIYKAMQHCTFTYIGMDKEHIEAREYMLKEFYPFIERLVNDIKEDKNA